MTRRKDSAKKLRQQVARLIEHWSKDQELNLRLATIWLGAAHGYTEAELIRLGVLKPPR